MKKLVILLAVLVAVPAFALEVTLTKDGDVVTVGYTGADPCNPPRAFALDLEVVGTGSATISLVADSYKLDGESTAASRGYGIYPARIDINSVTGIPAAYGTPLADPCDPGADESGTHLVLEFGSLYVGDANAPVVTGVTDGNLCEILVVCGTGNANLVMAAEVTYRGGVLLEDGTDASASATAEIELCAGEGPCLVVGQVVGGNLITQAMYDLWVLKGEPESWCYECHSKGDINDDCAIDGTDIMGYSATTGWSYSFNTAYTPGADINNDGAIDGTDIMGFNATSGWAYGFNNQCGTCTPQPE